MAPILFARAPAAHVAAAVEAVLGPAESIFRRQLDAFEAMAGGAVDLAGMVTDVVGPGVAAGLVAVLVVVVVPILATLATTFATGARAGSAP
jgi:hypothetical protein